ncbi:T9SS type B sorting domain-containing protein [Flavobacterium sp. Fl-77]|uniref:T9SS type B sorting domain-containing protein n=1 Tax=Flavobacterium flavipigmentatum TaxID=2893884 RepID=A0AAJ2SEY8_9FLAO|nr:MULTISPECIES: T9SS type B sorting domain-containing protein [unclassified Flavobacterium]MDX6183338.1 T9SS type B sorting domain-containing protein [Flavobacterium sp. Fl-33]MDX6186622.1 T9SS type B sorting domain-containing protein [Flavobacterium sp. Fl-77]UFH38609.1 T9SS type B sorting domain-containing protein [Flavobacterium sp. F-70]
MKRTLLFFFLIINSLTLAQNKNKSLGFKENKGQIIDQKGKSNTAVKYLLSSNGLNVQLKKNGFSYDIYEVKKNPSLNPRHENVLPSHFEKSKKEELPESSLEYTFHRIDIDFLNSSSKVELIAEEPSDDFENYYNILNKPDGILGVHQYKQITYKNIYPNIDIVFSIPKDPEKTVEYNFVIHPKGKISDIQLKFNGAETDLVDNKIQMSVRFGKMEETLPSSWSEEGNSKKEIYVSYKKIKRAVYGFDTVNAVDGKTIIIDPVPMRLWGTYYGGAQPDYVSSICTKDDFVYISGTTYSTINIASTGSNQNNYASIGNYDSFFAKLNSDGTRIWGTYYGGSSTDDIFQIKISNSNNIYIVGASLSNNNISTVGSHQPIKSKFYDGFVAKFDNNGTRQWGTYYGGLDNDNIYSITVDPNENIYICGATFSYENISTSNAHQLNIIKSSNNARDGFIAKLNKDGIRQWGTYYGGNNDDSISDSKIDSNGDIIFLGSSQSSSGISTIGSFKEFNENQDNFLVKFSPNGSRKWGTYFGGEKTDLFYYIGIDGTDNLYCFGETNSTINISTPGSFQQNFVANGLGKCGGIIKFDPNGFKIWGTYFFPEASGGSVTKNGSIYFIGRYENGFITTPNTYQEIKNAGTESYLVKFNTEGQREWATYFGGEKADNAIMTDVDNNSNVYLAGSTNSKTNIATSNTYQPNLYQDINGFTPNIADAFLVKFQDCLSNPTVSSNSPVCIGKTLELKASGGINYSWTGPNGFTSTDQNPTITNTSTTNIGEYSCLITGTGGCDDTKKITVAIGDVQAAVPDIATLPTITGDCHTTITTIPTATDMCAGAITGSTTNPLSYSLPGTYTIVWNYNDGNGNISHQNQMVTITRQPLPVANTSQNLCIQQNATLANIQITGQNIKWYNAAAAGTLLPSTTLLQNDIIYYATQTINGCESERFAVTAKIQNTLPPTGNANQSFCSGQNPTIANIQINGDLIKWYDAVVNGNPLSTSTNLQDGKTYYTSQTVNTCESERFGVTVSIENTPSAPTGNANQPFCKSQKATLDNIAIFGQNIKWYDTNFAAAVLPNTTLLENNKTYYASQTVGCESDRTPILIKVTDSTLPIAKNDQSFCIDENATIADINISGQDLIWYDKATVGNSLSTTTILENKTYFVTQTINNCESERVAINIKVQDTKPPIANSPQVFCIQKNALIDNIDIAGQNINWYESASSNIKLSELTPIENGATYYASQTTNSCESDKIPVTVNISEATFGDCINYVDELPFPKFFTPNNDGFNDIWTINFAYLAPNTGIRIFDRYGKFIKELPINASWDGTYSGQDEPASDYWFVVTRLNGKEFRSHFSLKR